MKFTIGDTVTIKNRSYMLEGNKEWVKIATQNKEELEIVKAVPMRGFIVRSARDKEALFSGSDLRKVG